MSHLSEEIEEIIDRYIAIDDGATYVRSDEAADDILAVIANALTSDDVVDKGTQAIERWEAKWAEEIRLLPEDCEVYARDVITAALDAADLTKGRGNE